jgi:SpoVK/Ycf46/Vps4 family AAA+-type ATPase
VLTFGCSVRGEILVFDCGRWHKDRELVKSIEQASFENLVLKAGQADSILREMEWFFESREVYERFDAPWKRGALLIGPPGNGKTHTLKALINRLRKPTVYVKSLEQGGDAPSQDGLRYVFNRVRSLAPCILVLEDLDSMITDDNRSYFLNEMDGFASNSGVLVLATTNHPERIDPAIAHRPSRFDRKYHFDLPETAERKSYLQMWNSQRSPEGQIRFEDSDIDSVARETEGFSYAYIKELMLSVVMECFHRNGNRPIRDIALEQAAQLRKQMSSAESDKAGEVNDNGNNPGAVANDNRPTRKERKRVRRERGGDRSF